MDAAGTPRESGKRSISKKAASSSFRLRSDSLNSLRLRRIFDIFDKNNDGVITVEELSRALNLLGLEVDLAELDSTVKSFTQPGNHGLRFEDFRSLHESLDETYFGGADETAIAACNGGTAGSTDEEEEMKMMSQEEADLSEAFKVFDEDGDGYISATELQAVLGKLGLSEGSEIDRVERMIISVDRNLDGRVDFFEFKDMMRSVVVRSS
ncbi:Calcium-binding allergen Bet v 3 [Morella rubra]|uniref:Calcium-binding allergen Bet v 3 n=1 Tax=Morella rubra TaxID=262757 RepID=A0A6A1WJP4_9ROSI|nr:Calcium-binding allergen Bet v 3 [Morella rubra]